MCLRDYQYIKGTSKELERLKRDRDYSHWKKVRIRLGGGEQNRAPKQDQSVWHIHIWNP